MVCASEEPQVILPCLGEAQHASSCHRWVGARPCDGSRKRCLGMASGQCDSATSNDEDKAQLLVEGRQSPDEDREPEQRE